MNTEQITKFIFGSITNILKVRDFLEQYPDLDPRQYSNAQKSNIIHHLSFYDHRQLIQLYVTHTARLIRRQIQKSSKLYQKDVNQQIAAWINEQNVEGFTPILYAAFNGHIQLIKDLEQLGANVTAVNSTKLNVLHMAAQNNKVAPFIHFCDKISLRSVDEKGNTPLHWAAYSGGQDVAAYILSKKDVEVNVKDTQGQTPLLLATIYGNTKIVRRLLLKGAFRSIRSNSGLLPIEVARQNGFTNIEKMLDVRYTALDLFKFYYNVKLEYRPKTRKLTIPIVFILTTLTTLVIIHSLIDFKKQYILYAQAAIIGLMLLLYLSLLLPPKRKQQQKIQSYINETRKMCFECLHKKPKRSFHCDICKVCIEQYDHHCTWINNCVGKRNIGRFVIFIFLLVISLGWIGFISIWNWLVLVTHFNNILENAMSFRTTSIQEPYSIIIRAGLLTINILVSLFFFPVLLLLLVQIKNILVNKTTYQRIRGDNGSVKQKLKSKKKSGMSMKNCKAMCGKNRQSFSSTDQSFHDQLLSQ